ncbi:transcriptional coactivator/pterin dehydratase [Sodiomyces alkalinus F11]|uniref:4a-hydroxytetrahydrobiopterin dehydratase n=1 Tax=Sodiomyces alkalinus (strain CBS 110278 / VKM F-3762 / F11) TaxID=1314773 RepID=A0A3N2PYB6_SODAK|nr:transcriptional coactivator/pterin dehydratase [Sodiomyces alkalinus F11]ROT39406.1 transcriptional coactivator/pterin dehydratase [Sodiomyces alkalinus F11]
MGLQLMLPRLRPTLYSAQPRLILPSTRHHNTHARTMSQQAPAPTPKFSPGADTETLRPAVDKLLRESGGRWTLSKDGEAVERNFKFKTFTKTWDFMTAVSLQCKIRNHHPEWSNVYNTTFIRWTTHNPKGLSDRDVHLAALCDTLARDFGEVIEDPSPSSVDQKTNTMGDRPDEASCAMGQLAGAAVSAAGDCCGRKPQ